MFVEIVRTWTGTGHKILNFVSCAAIGAMGNMATMPIIQSKRNVFYKQRDSGFYPTILYALSDYLADYPQQILEVSILGIVVYFFVGFQTSSFGLFYGFLFLSTLMFINLYKAIAVHTATKTAAQVRFDTLHPTPYTLHPTLYILNPKLVQCHCGLAVHTANKAAAWVRDLTSSIRLILRGLAMTLSFWVCRV
jgi:hypothetical protein